MTPWQEVIDKELEWRKAELAALKLKLFEEKPSGVQQNTLFKTLLRASWTMLYAHYEGFTIFLFSEYLDRLERMNIPRKDCAQPLQLASFRHHLPKMRNLPEAEFILFLREGYSAKVVEPIEFPRKKAREDEFELKGRSNLWPWLLHECCEQHCVPTAGMDPKDMRLRLLVGRRNEIAHGKDTPVKDYDEYDAYHNYVLDRLDVLAQTFAQALARCLYLDSAVKHRETATLAYQRWLSSGGDAEANWAEAERRLADGIRC